MDYDKSKPILFVDLEMSKEQLEACLKEAEYQDRQGCILWSHVTLDEPEGHGLECCGGLGFMLGKLRVIWEDYHDEKYRYWWAEGTGCDEQIEFVICDKCKTLTISRDN